MKKFLLAAFFAFVGVLSCQPAHAQLQEAEQLALDIEKLAQFKSILQEMYKGYQILTGGYNAIKSIAEGNFNLHNAFLTGLMSVNPAVKQYVRVADIISAEITLVNNYKSALTTFNGSGRFSVSELSYITNVYANLFDQSLNNLDELTAILTDGKLRMNDAERLNAIDRLYYDQQDKLTFLNQFNAQAGVLAGQRQHDLQDLGTVKSLYGQ
jgi:hypothetical protein